MQEFIKKIQKPIIYTLSALLSQLVINTNLNAHEALHAEYCDITPADNVMIKRPQADDQVKFIDDINWFSRPVRNPQNDYIVTYASHNQNYLFNLSKGTRAAIPDRSDAVATPDGRFITVPSHYTKDNSVNFYDTATLLRALETGKDARNTKPVFEHRHKEVFNTFYQSVGLLPVNKTEDSHTINYRMMFSGSLPPTPPGFLIVDYKVVTKNDRTTFTPSPVLQLCPEIIDDMATPFISKDGRYIIAHDNSDIEQDATLKLFEIMNVDYQTQTTNCKMLIDFGFQAGKADFSYDNSKITFHLSSNDYVTRFISGGLNEPNITDIVVVNLNQDKSGAIKSVDNISRLTTSIEHGKGKYFPAFFPDGSLFYIGNNQSKSNPHFPVDDVKDRRFELFVVDPEKSSYGANVFQSKKLLKSANTIGRLWRKVCSPGNNIISPGNNPLSNSKMAWHFTGLSKQQCKDLVKNEWTGSSSTKRRLYKACNSK